MALSDHGHPSVPRYKMPLSSKKPPLHRIAHSSLNIRMAPSDHEVPYGDLNIGGREHILSFKMWLFLTQPLEVVSTLHQQRYNTTHFNTIRAQRIPPHLPLSHKRSSRSPDRAHAGNTTKSYITTSRNRIHQMVRSLPVPFWENICSRITA